MNFGRKVRDWWRNLERNEKKDYLLLGTVCAFCIVVVCWTGISSLLVPKPDWFKDGTWPDEFVGAWRTETRYTEYCVWGDAETCAENGGLGENCVGHELYYRRTFYKDKRVYVETYFDGVVNAPAMYNWKVVGNQFFYNINGNIVQQIWTLNGNTLSIGQMLLTRE